MIPAILSSLANHLWQSTIFLIAAGLMAVAFRRKRAQIRYWIWFSASLKFLVPFSLLVGAGSQFGWRTSPTVGPAAFSHAVEQISQPFAPQSEAVPAVTVTASWHKAPVVLFGVWLFGFAISTFVWFRWWRRFRSAIRIATPLDLDLSVPVMTSPGRLEPGVFGIRKPILLLPEGFSTACPPSSYSRFWRMNSAMSGGATI